MDWFSWLSKTNLDPSLVYDYAIVFSHNELEEDDIGYFNHEFLQSMGISVAKHRLEILKLARKEKCRIARLRPIMWLLIAIKQTKNYIAKRIQVQVSQDDSALTLMPLPQRNYSSRWRAAMLNKKFLAATAKRARPMLTYGNGNDITPVESGQAILMLTNGSPVMGSPSLKNSFSSPKFPGHCRNDKSDGADDGEDLVDSVESVRWEDMFQDLKPT